MYKSLLLFYFLSLFISGFGQSSNIEKDLLFLSSDEMKGRENGSDEAEKAANYIANRFKEIGLSSPDFCSDYLQKIELINVQNRSKELIINNLAIPEDNIILLSHQDRLFINDTADLKLFTVGEHEDIMNIFTEVVNYPTSYVVFLHPIHSKRFERLKRYFTTDKLQVKKDNDYFSLWIKTAESSLENIQFTATNKIESISIYNVIGELTSKVSNERKWIFSAHYDHIGVVNPIDGDSIANGANDDASGVVSVIKLAEKFAHNTSIDKSIYFIAFAGEELGLYGSKYLAKHLDLNTIEAMVNIEMVGEVNNDLGPQSAYINGYDYSYLPKDMTNAIDNDEFMFFPDPYPNLNLFRRSDNAPFAAMGIPAHSISSYNEGDERYHSVNDEIEYLDLNHIQEVINAIYSATLPMLQLGYDPGRIDGKTKTDR